MPDSSSHSARKLCSSKSASTWREKVTSERSLRTQYTVSSMARARPSSVRLGPASAQGCGQRQGLAGAADSRRRVRARSLAPSLPHTRSVTHSLPPSPASTAAATLLRLRLPACRPASHRCRQVRQPPSAPPRRNAAAVKPACPSPLSRRGGGAGPGGEAGSQTTRRVAEWVWERCGR